MKENNSLENFYLTYNYIIRKLWFVNAVFALSSILFQRYQWAAGFLVGSISAHFFFFMLRRDIEKMAQSDNFSPARSFAGHLSRYLGVGVIFAIAISSDFVNIAALFAGFFMLHFILFAIKFNERKDKEK